MFVIKPSKNPLSQGYSVSHKGYDFRGLNLPDEVLSGMDGEIIERVDEFSTNWTNNGKLTTKDYGNYIKVRHTDGSYALFAHLRQGSSYIKGTKVKAGQITARIGNTGNSTGPHLHAEYRDSNNKNTEVVFIDLVEEVFKLSDNISSLVEEKLNLKNYKRYQRHWTFEDLIRDWVTLTQFDEGAFQKRIAKLEMDNNNKIDEIITLRKQVTEFSDKLGKTEKDLENKVKELDEVTNKTHEDMQERDLESKELTDEDIVNVIGKLSFYEKIVILFRG